MLTTALPVKAQGTKYYYDDPAAPTSATQTIFWDTLGPPLDLQATGGDMAAASYATYDAFVATHWTALGIASASDYFTAKLDAWTLEETDDLPVADQVGLHRIRLTPRINGLIAVDHPVTLTFFMGNLRAFEGRVLPRAATLAAAQALLASTPLDYQTVRATAKSQCTGEFRDIAAESEFVDFGRGHRYFAFGCGEIGQRCSSIAGTLLLTYSFNSLDWPQFLPSAPTAGIALADKTSPNARQWMNTNWISYNSEPQATFQTRVDRKNPAVAPCEFRTSISSNSGNESAWGWPTLRLNDNANIYNVTGNCTTAVGALDRSTAAAGGAAYRVQTAWIQLERSADIARRDLEAGLFRTFRTERNTFTSKAYTNTPGACWGNSGVYNRVAEFLCLNTDTMRNRWGTAIHEYGHYIQDELETIGDLQACLDCGCNAWVEGSADALNVSILHRIYAQVFTYTEAERDLLFRNGPGLSRSGFRASHQPYVQLSSTCGNAYAKGMIYSQILWKLINNRLCTSFVNNACVGTQTISQSVDPVPRAGRRALSAALGSATPYLQASLRQWLGGTLWLLIAGNAASITELNRVRTAFSEHGVIP